MRGAQGGVEGGRASFPTEPSSFQHSEARILTLEGMLFPREGFRGMETTSQGMVVA